jgi:hypothetical protein
VCDSHQRIFQSVIEKLLAGHALYVCSSASVYRVDLLRGSIKRSIMIEKIERGMEIILHRIIDELNPLFLPITDEYLIEDRVDYGLFTRDFRHRNGKKFRLKWRVYYGTPETVRTVFEPTVEI